MNVNAPATFPKMSRLRKRAEYVQLASAKNKTSVRGFLVVWCKNEHLTARVGITASKKVGCAVVRSRIKRAVREYFRLVRLRMPNVDINVIARLESAQMNHTELFRELNKAFHCIGVTKCSQAASSL